MTGTIGFLKDSTGRLGRVVNALEALLDNIDGMAELAKKAEPDSLRGFIASLKRDADFIRDRLD